MGMKAFEAEILRELRIVAKNSKLRQKDIQEWSTSDVEIKPGEKHYYLPTLHINVAVLEAQK